MLPRTFCFPMDPGSLLVNSVASVFTCSVANARVSWNSTTSSELNAKSVVSVTCSITSAFCVAAAVGDFMLHGVTFQKVAWRSERFSDPALISSVCPLLSGSTPHSNRFLSLHACNTSICHFIGSTGLRVTHRPAHPSRDCAV